MQLQTLIPDVLILTSLVCVCVLSLVGVRRALAPNDERLVKEINRLLPQTQCAQCGYPGCRPYAKAMADGEAINLCPPGGDRTVQQLAEMLGRPQIAPDAKEPTPLLARISEKECIGCTLCIAACPVDAIIGAQQHMHTVITELCTGCKLCIEPCPVDCIKLVPLPVSKEPDLPYEQMACINCGLCEVACPRELLPHILYQYRKSRETPQALHLDACIECKRCDQVCPSQISLTRSFQIAKQKQATMDQKQVAARENERRFSAKQARIYTNQAEVVSKPTPKEHLSIMELIKTER